MIKYGELKTTIRKRRGGGSYASCTMAVYSDRRRVGTIHVREDGGAQYLPTERIGGGLVFKTLRQCQISIDPPIDADGRIRIERRDVDRALFEECLKARSEQDPLAVIPGTTYEQFVSGTDGAVVEGSCGVCDLYLERMGLP